MRLGSALRMQMVPIPGLKFIQYVDLVIVDAVQDVSQIGQAGADLSTWRFRLRSSQVQ